MTVKTYSFENGKYQLDRDSDTYEMTAARRHGEPWPAGLDGFRFSKCVHAMLNRIDELESEIVDYEATIERMAEQGSGS